MATILQSLAHVSPEARTLRDIRCDDCNLAIWERAPVEGMERLLEGDPADLRFVTTPLKLADHMRSEMAASGYAKGPEQARLIEDATDLAEMFCSIIDSHELGVRLEIVTTDSCKKFHADYVLARLITTYVGDGTQWLEQPDADRLAQGLEPERINQMSAGDIGIFKGKQGTSQPAIHRSPPIGDSGQKRLLLVFNHAPPS
ncbi:MAG: DUF1826 domain-containing protein [Erythrobacter sp.]